MAVNEADVRLFALESNADGGAYPPTTIQTVTNAYHIPVARFRRIFVIRRRRTRPPPSVELLIQLIAASLTVPSRAHAAGAHRAGEVGGELISNGRIAIEHIDAEGLADDLRGAEQEQIGRAHV